jgi:hypothetical protein
MGPELFDKSFKEYARRWAFKHPEPADFFRTMEDASAVDLDWFWNGWFYTTDYCDQSVDKVRWFKLRTNSTDVENKDKNVATGDVGKTKKEHEYKDFTEGPEYLTITPTDKRLYYEFNNQIDDQAVIRTFTGKNIYEVTLSNKGGLMMPVIIQWNYIDGTSETERIPAEIWRYNENQLTKVFAKGKQVASVEVDPKKETSDINTDNNTFPKKPAISKFDELKKKTN